MDSVFHLAFPVHSLETSYDFYHDLLGCEIGRRADNWIDIDFFGHQLSLHQTNSTSSQTPDQSSVEGKAVPIPHFGVILPLDKWHSLLDTLQQANQAFILPPQTRFEGQPGEQRTMFFYDPSGNAIEIKGVKDFKEVFAK